MRVSTPRLRVPCHRLVLDLVGVLVLSVLVVAGSVGEAHQYSHARPAPLADLPNVVGYAVVFVASIIMVWRRRWPLAVFLVSLAAVVFYTMMGKINGAAMLAPMVGLYTLTVSGGARRAIAMGAVASVLLMAADVAFNPVGPFYGPLPVTPLVVATVVCAGLLIAKQQALLRALNDRVAETERAREQQAQHRVDIERIRIARELHDVLAHTISVIGIQARAAQQVVGTSSPALSQAIAAINSASRDAMRELREILAVLRQPNEQPPAGPPPGLHQLDTLISNATQSGLRISQTVTGTPRRLTPAVELAAYRIIQESLTNVLRHARHAAVGLTIHYRTNELAIEVTDDGGDGNRAPSPETHQGFGIVGMRDRANAVGGALFAGPNDRGGFTVRASLPLDGTQ